MVYFGDDWKCGPSVPFNREWIIKSYSELDDKEKIYIEHVKKSFENSEKNISSLIPEISKRKNFDGMSGEKTRHLYNNICSLKDSNYLEIGCWSGSTLCSSMYSNNLYVTVIDNFSWGGAEIKKTFVNNCNKYNINNNIINIIDSDSFSVDLANIKNKYNIYLYDGCHSYNSHYNALTYYISVLDDLFIFIVDDWNIPRVRDATYRSIKDLNLKILYEREIIYTDDDRHTPQPFAEENYWNGIYVTLLKKT